MSRVIKTFENLRRQRLEDVYEQERLQGTMLYLKTMTVVFLIIGVWVSVILPTWPLALYYASVILFLLILKAAQYHLLKNRAFGLWVPFAVTAVEAAILGAAFIFQSPFGSYELPPQIMLRWGNFAYLFIIISGAALSFSPILVLWAGFCVSLVWGLGVIWIISLPDTITLFGSDRLTVGGFAGFRELFFHPNFVHVQSAARDIIVALLISGMLAVVVWRSRRLVQNHAESERKRANLARYFSPNVLDDLSEANVPLLEVRQHDVAILFADIVGFTAISESLPPVKVMEFLRKFHNRMEEEVFRYGGTLDKYIGDAVMVSFGAPRRGSHDATNALRCALSMQQSIAELNREREISNEPFIRMGIGVHYGPAVMGDIGSERASAFAVIGDTTNTASRLQTLTRDLKVDVVVSQDAMDAYKRETTDTEKILGGFIDVGSQLIQGRKGAIHVWTLISGTEVPVG